MTLTERVRALFWSRVAIGYPDECWLWTGRIDTARRGQFRWPEMSQGKQFISASRAAWILEFGPITADRMFVCHRCDVPRCCNPKHLFLGTAKQNTRDAIAKGRYRKAPPAPKGSKYNAKMTWDSRSRHWCSDIHIFPKAGLNASFIGWRGTMIHSKRHPP